MINRVEPTESQKKAFQFAFVVLAIILASVALIIFLILLGGVFGWLPAAWEWEPIPKQR